MGNLATRVRTERLVLRSLTHADGPAIFRSFTPAVTRYMTPPSPRRPAETDGFVDSAIERMQAGTDLVCAVTLAEGGGFLGCAGLHRLETSRPELGIWIREDAWGHGFGLEAVSALRDWASAGREPESLGYPVDRRNGPSRRIAERLGGEIVEGPTPSPTQDGRCLEILRYRIPAAAFPHLSPRLRRHVVSRFAVPLLHALEALAAEGVHDGQDGERVLTAVLCVAGEGAERFDEAVRVARTDCRDLLVAASLADEDWPARLERILGA